MDDTNNYRTIEVPEIIRDLFLGIQLIWPNFGTSVSPKDKRATQLIWARKLMHFSRDAIMDALEEVPDFHPNRAPSLGQFHLLCKKHRSAIAAKELRKRAITDNRAANPEIQRKAMQEIYAVTGKLKLKPKPLHMNAEAIQERKRKLLEQAAEVIK